MTLDIEPEIHAVMIGLAEISFLTMVTEKCLNFLLQFHIVPKQKQPQPLAPTPTPLTIMTITLNQRDERNEMKIRISLQTLRITLFHILTQNEDISKEAIYHNIAMIVNLCFSTNEHIRHVHRYLRSCETKYFIKMIEDDFQ